MDELDDRLDMSTWRYKYVDGAGDYKSDEDPNSSISFKQNTIVKRYLRRREEKEIRREEKDKTGTAKETSRQNKWFHQPVAYI